MSLKYYHYAKLNIVKDNHMEQDWKYIKKYNFVFSLGAACTCTDMIRRMKLQDYSYPFDWVWGSSFVERFNYLIIEKVKEL